MDGNIAALDKWMERNEYLSGVADAIIGDAIDNFIELSREFDNAAFKIENEISSLSCELEDRGIYLDTSSLADDISKTKGAEAVASAIKYINGECDGN